MTERPDIELAARVRANRLRFRTKPEVTTRFTGDAVTSSAGARENLPDEVQPGVTYRDVSIRWHASARLDPRLREELGG